MITAWLAITVATVAKMTTGSSAQSGASRKNGLVEGLGVLEHQRTLAEIVQRQRREDQPGPRGLDRRAAEMAHVGIERLGAGDGEEHAAQDGKAHGPVREQEAHRIGRVECGEHLHVVLDVQQPQHGHGEEPECRDRAEQGRHLAGAVPLCREQGEQDRHGHRDHVGLEHRRHQLQALDRGKDRDRRGDQRVAIEQGRTRDAEQEYRRCRPAERPLGQRHQRERAALAVIVGAHEEQDVLAGDDEDQRPKEERGDPQHLRARDPAILGVVQRLAQGVERAGADVAVDDADRAQRQRPEAGLGPVACVMFRAIAVMARFHGHRHWRVYSKSATGACGALVLPRAQSRPGIGGGAPVREPRRLAGTVICITKSGSGASRQVRAVRRGRRRPSRGHAAPGSA